MNADQQPDRPQQRSLDAIKGSLAALSHAERDRIAEVSPAACRLLADIPGLVELAESYRERFGPLALANVQRNPAPISERKAATAFDCMAYVGSDGSTVDLRQAGKLWGFDLQQPGMPESHEDGFKSKFDALVAAAHCAGRSGADMSWEPIPGVGVVSVSPVHGWPVGEVDCD